MLGRAEMFVIARRAFLPSLTRLPMPQHHCCVVAVRGLAKGGKGGKASKGGKSGKSDKGSEGGKAQDDADDLGTENPVDVEALKEQMQRPLEHMLREFSSIQTGRAGPSLLEAIKADVGAGAQPIKALAKVLAAGPQVLQVSPFDNSHVSALAKAIESTGNGLRAEIQGKMLKVHVPRMTQETRQAMAKHVRVLGEAAKTAVRGVRQKAMKKAKSASSKEETKRIEKEVEEVTKEASQAVDKAMTAKEKDVLTV